MSGTTISAEAYRPLYDFKGKHFDTLNGSDFVNGAITPDNKFYDEYYWLLGFYEKHPLPTPIASDDEVKMLIHYAESGYAHNDFKKLLDKNRALKDYIKGPTITDSELAQLQANSTVYKDMPPLPPGFHADFMIYGTGQKYSYPPFFFAASLALVAAVVGNSVVMRSTGGNIHPNVNIISFGPTTISGKSQANSLMMDELFDEVIKTTSFIKQMEDPQSAAALKQGLADNTAFIWWIDEVGELLNKIKTGTGGANGILETICTAYDGRKIPYSRSSKDLSKANDQVILRSNYSLNQLWSCTNTDLEESLSWNMASKGMLSRFIMFGCMGTNPTRKNRERTAKDDADRDDLIKQILSLKAKIDLIPAAKGSDGHPIPDQIQFAPNDIIEDWSIENNKKYANLENEVERIATARSPQNAYKIAMSLAIFDVANTITKETVFPVRVNLPDDICRYVIKLMEDFLIPRAIWAVRCARSQDDGKNAILNITKQLEKHNRIANRSVILKFTHLQKKVFDDAIETMVESCALKISPGESTGGRIAQVLQLI